MATMYVDAEALNLRTDPTVDADNRIAILHLCQKVETVDAPATDGWVKVTAEVEGQPREGFVSSKFLRKPVAPPREALVARAIREWLRFEKGLGRENEEPFFRFVGEMWQAIGINLTGKDVDTPWSAAAISFVVRNAAQDFAQYGTFRFAAAHAKYTFDAISRRNSNDATAPFWGFKLMEAQPQIGDMVCKWREMPQTFDTAAMSDAYKSHCDIVVQVGPDDVLAIGGNVGNSMSLTTYRKTPSGFLAPTDNVFALLANRVT